MRVMDLVAHPPLGTPPPIPLQSEEGTTKRFSGYLPERQGQNLALTVLHVPHSRDGPRGPPGRLHHPRLGIHCYLKSTQVPLLL